MKRTTIFATASRLPFLLLARSHPERVSIEYAGMSLIILLFSSLAFIVASRCVLTRVFYGCCLFVLRRVVFYLCAACEEGKEQTRGCGRFGPRTRRDDGERVKAEGNQGSCQKSKNDGGCEGESTTLVSTQFLLVMRLCLTDVLYGSHVFTEAAQCRCCEDERCQRNHGRCRRARRGFKEGQRHGKLGK